MFWSGTYIWSVDANVRMKGFHIGVLQPLHQGLVLHIRSVCQKGRLEVSGLMQTASLDLTSLPNPSPSVGSLPKTSSSIHPAQLGEPSVTAATMPVFCSCYYSVMSTACGESDPTPVGVEG